MQQSIRCLCDGCKKKGNCPEVCYPLRDYRRSRSCIYYSEIRGSVYFPSEKALLSAIKELGEDNVKKYILGVKE